MVFLAAISARCTFVGVGGSVLAGGIGWLSCEYGLASDPHNMLDAQVVKINGEITWASEEPDLLWALRGGGGGFAGMFHQRVSDLGVSKNTKA
jgi:FAD/FMN-containing dehydrogenase